MLLSQLQFVKNLFKFSELYKGTSTYNLMNAIMWSDGLTLYDD